MVTVMESNVLDLWWTDKDSTCCRAALRGRPVCEHHWWTLLFMSQMTSLPLEFTEVFTWAILMLVCFFTYSVIIIKGIVQHFACTELFALRVRWEHRYPSNVCVLGTEVESQCCQVASLAQVKAYSIACLICIQTRMQLVILWLNFIFLG